MKDIDEVSGDVLNIALRLHRELGPGLLESVYESLLALKLEQMGYAVVRQSPVSVEFEGLVFEGAFRADLIVDGRLLVEVEVDRTALACAREAIADLPSSYQTARRASHQFRRRNPEGRRSAHSQ